jgi:hypothetical protein
VWFRNVRRTLERWRKITNGWFRTVGWLLRKLREMEGYALHGVSAESHERWTRLKKGNHTDKAVRLLRKRLSNIPSSTLPVLGSL